MQHVSSNGDWTYDDIVVHTQLPRVSREAITLSVGDQATVSIDPYQATRLAGRLVRASSDVSPSRSSAALEPQEFALLVRLLRRYAETEMDQWDTFSFTTSFGEVSLLLTMGGPVDPTLFHSLDGFTAYPPAETDGRTNKGEGGWTFGFDDERIERLHVDRRVVLELGDDTKVVLGTRCAVTLDGVESSMDPEVPATLAPVLGVVHRAVQRIEVSLDGVLMIELADGGRVESAPDPAFENWELILPDGAMYVGLPGGGVASFPAA